MWNGHWRRVCAVVDEGNKAVFGWTESYIDDGNRAVFGLSESCVDEGNRVAFGSTESYIKQEATGLSLIHI